MTTLADIALWSDPAMTVVTTVVGDTRAGCLVGFHSQSGMAPDSYAVWLSTANHTYDVARRADRFAVHFLRVDQHDLARHFGTLCGAEIDKFEQVAWTQGPGGVPLLEDCLDRIVGTRRSLLDAGSDHACLVLDRLEVSNDPRHAEPLRLSQVVDLDAAHAAPET